MPRTALLPVILLLWTGACANPGGSETVQALIDQPSAGTSKAQDEEAEEAAWELAQAERSLSLAEWGTASALTRAERDVHDAELDLARAERELEAFEASAQTEVASARLSLKRVEINVLENTEELAELETMYELDEFAATTEALVIGRGRRQLQMAEERLKIEVDEFEQLQKYELAEDRRQHAEAIEAAKLDLELARRDLEEARLEAEGDLLEARREVEQAKQAVDEAGGA